MKEIYGLEIYVHTPERKYNYMAKSVFKNIDKAYKLKKTILDDDRNDNFIERIEIITLYLT